MPRAEAHRLRPAIATLTLQEDDTYSVSILLNVEVLLAGISPLHQDTNESPQAQEYDVLRLSAPDALTARVEAFSEDFLSGIEIRFDGRRSAPRIVSIEVPAVGDPAGCRARCWDLGADTARVRVPAAGCHGWTSPERGRES